MNKILYKIILYMPEFLISMVFVMSMLPLFNDNHKEDYYIFSGAVFSFLSWISINFHEDKKHHPAITYSIMLCVILIMFIISLAVVGSKMSGEQWNTMELFFCPYFGSFFGIAFANAIENIDKKQKHKNGK